MFETFPRITLIDYARPLAERAAARKSVGPYTWSPARPMAGRGFYQALRGGLRCDPRGSTFNLRLKLANDHLSGCGYGSLARINGYFADPFGEGDTLTPIIARLPRGHGFLAGWTMGAGMCATLAPTIYADAEDAARAAHAEADADADAERERDAFEAGLAEAA